MLAARDPFGSNHVRVRVHSTGVYSCDLDTYMCCLTGFNARPVGSGL